MLGRWFVRKTDPETVRAHVTAAQANGGRCVVALGQCPATVDDQPAERIGVIDVTSRPRVLLDRWMTRNAIVELSSALGSTSMAGWDVMFATSWRWAWGGAPFAVWSRRGLVARVDGPRRLFINHVERSHDVQAVRAEVSKYWANHRVGVVTTAGQQVWVARRRELGPLIDPLYDGLDLLADAGWAAALAARLAGALEVRLETNHRALG